MSTTKKKVLFFIDGPAPAAEDSADVDTIIAANPRFQVVFRNGQSVSIDDPVERCDFVAGEEIPEKYTKFERVKYTAVKRKQDAIKK